MTKPKNSFHLKMNRMNSEEVDFNEFSLSDCLNVFLHVSILLNGCVCLWSSVLERYSFDKTIWVFWINSCVLSLKYIYKVLKRCQGDEFNVDAILVDLYHDIGKVWVKRGERVEGEGGKREVVRQLEEIVILIPVSWKLVAVKAEKVSRKNLRGLWGSCWMILIRLKLQMLSGRTRTGAWISCAPPWWRSVCAPPFSPGRIALFLLLQI